MFSKKTTKEFFSVAGPMAAARLVGILSTIIGAAMIAHLGHAQLAAGALISTLRIAIAMLGIGVLFALAPITARAFGQGKLHCIGQLARSSALMTMLLSVPLMLLYHFIGPILIDLHQAPDIVHYVTEFFNAFFWAAPSMLLVVAFQQVSMGAKQQKMVMFGSMLSLGVSALFNYTLIFGHFGAPALGVGGMGYAFAFTTWLQVLYYLSCFLWLKKLKPFALFSWRNTRPWHHIKNIIRIGWPISAQFTGELLAPTVTAVFVGWLGENALAAQQILFQYLLLTVVPIFAMAEAASVTVGHAYGRKDYNDARLTGNTAIAWALIVSSCMLILFISIPVTLTHFFTDAAHPLSQSTYTVLPTLFCIMGIGRLFDGINDVACGALRALYDTRVPMAISLLGTWILNIPLSYLFAFTLHGGIKGIWLASLLALAISGSIMCWRWRSRSHCLCKSTA